MSINLHELFAKLSEAGLTLRRGDGGTIEVVGNLARVTDSMRDAVQINLPALITCLPEPPLSPEEQATANADHIRDQLNEFADWLFTVTPWATVGLSRSEDIDQRIAAAVDTQEPQRVAEEIAGLQSDLEVINWAAEILPSSYETEAKAKANPADDGDQIDGIPF